jgi:AcrR family transcriptional regulator
VPRRYVSELRARQALGTRARVLRAAAALFLRRGYVGTTIESVAARAGVSVQSVYNTVGGKAALLKAVYDVLLAGDEEPVPIAERPLFRAILAAPDGRTALALYARLGRELWERIGPLVTVVLAQASAGGADLRGFVTTIEGERARGNAGLVAHLADTFGLRQGLSREAAADILWTLTAPEVMDRLVTRRGWTLDAAQEWLAGAMADALFGAGPDDGPARCRRPAGGTGGAAPHLGPAPGRRPSP